jgi:hypothetical protein
VELTPSDRPRPDFLKVRNRNWWNQRSLWVLIALFVLVMAAAGWVVHQLYFYSEAPGSRLPLPSRHGRAG